MRTSGWLWQLFDRGGAGGAMRTADPTADGVGEAARRLGPRTLRHHLVIIVCWLALAIGLTYWLAN